jgi:hypothetical protein
LSAARAVTGATKGAKTKANVSANCDGDQRREQRNRGTVCIAEGNPELPRRAS